LNPPFSDLDQSASFFLQSVMRMENWKINGFCLKYAGVPWLELKGPGQTNGGLP